MTDPWDAAAATFDDEADHGLRDPAVRAAWATLLLPLMPQPPARIIDVGCGTGSLAVLLARAGHRVSGVDTSGQMLGVARAKAAAAGVRLDLARGDAASPPFAPESMDAVLCRHVLWALPDRDAVLASWTRLLRPHGRLVLVEGRWATGAGLPAVECRDLVLRRREQALVRQLSGDAALWGGRVDDERYVLVSTR
ncbi:class I SAM-dependent methyltransferase [Blastococcus sp. CT_GayMR16]|uniref:class I SAM-dependent methyltransferase n=1 Tax=Blastococcus sp. CT_GayMR16 TaxID=2559607 RepID=UPI0010744303|nr:class I SAM-dependent methyltransferase [Blastococcus sp. CT_GayMR16]TFV91261.1 class I SAM-dependent methyltransferase [Blastococcus sp. CT_GayMR16]